MVTALDKITIGDVLFVTADKDPTTDGGLDVPIGSVVTVIDGSGTFTKVGSGLTEYVNTNMPFGTARSYYFTQDWEFAGVPSGWNQANNLGQVNVNPQPDSGTLGIYQIGSGASLGGRVGLQYAPSVNFLNQFTDAFYTKSIWKINLTTIPVAPNNNSVALFGWANTNASISGAVGNALCVMYDPTNASGYNPTLITNWFLLARTASYGVVANTLLDLGVAPVANTYREFVIVYNNVLSQVEVYRDGVILGILTDLSNVPAGSVRGVIPPAAGAALSPVIYVGNSTTLASTSIVFKIDKHTTYKLYQ
jgi:hypothetical protein